MAPDARPTFEAVAPCASVGSYVVGSSVTLAGTAFDHPCLAVRVGASVSFRWALSADPLVAITSRGTAGNPIPTTATGASVTVTFPARGYFPYRSMTRGNADGTGLAGVVYVLP